MAKSCWFKKNTTESNATTSNGGKTSDEECDAEASFAVEEEELALAVTAPGTINYNNDWIVDSGCSNHITGDKEKLQNITEYKGGRVVMTANNSRLTIGHVEKTTIIPRFSSNEVLLLDVYHIPG
ncbi:hypothetical protein RND71_025847 [Anisodus tanguticus]|uniref:Retrovirus-related Pol polyprotein from transposon TNT 1-94-like beta-barrel domain-containing protein n=1 Tax=Anisodus tanguticus TaxID=243964 RepID=A0AAE1RL25_9SOLA|nr:hypothetical protein RND71_025847 [Anisodus tanguticus]